LKQLGLGLSLSTKRTRKRGFLEQMERVAPWTALVQIVEPNLQKAKTMFFESPVTRWRPRSMPTR
jgi:IS5 family transposase